MGGLGYKLGIAFLTVVFTMTMVSLYAYVIDVRFRRFHPTCRPYNPHLDVRFTDDCMTKYEPAQIAEKVLGLLDALQSMAPDIKFTLMYGGLIGYYMNGELLPFDDDLDLVVLGDDEMNTLKEYDGWETDEYLFEFQPWYNKRAMLQILAAKWLDRSIDARMICKETGIFIDLTFLYYVPSMDIYQARDFNTYHAGDLLPLRLVEFHGRSIYIPHNVERTLKARYGPVLSFNRRTLVGGQWQDTDTDSVVHL